MLAIIGLVVVTVSVLTGYVWEGGPLHVLMQPAEFLIIGGAAVGTLSIATTPSVLKQLIRQATGVLKSSQFSPVLYLDMLQLLYELLVKAKKSGLIALEKDLAKPESSPIFSGHPKFLACHEAVVFTTEALGMLVDGTMRPDDFEMVLGTHLDTHHDEEGRASAVLTKVGDALPGLGIVAAVLGIVITMQSVDGKAAEIGEKVAAALVGTFLGIFLSYGYVQPLAASIEAQAAAETRFLQCIKSCLVAFARGAPPLVAVEVARHVMFSDDRPNAEALAEACRTAGKKAA
jgi:chemotaxis protein MotA